MSIVNKFYSWYYDKLDPVAYRLALRDDQKEHDLFDIAYGSYGVKIGERVYYFNTENDEYYYLDLKTYCDYPLEVVNTIVTEKTKEYMKSPVVGFADNYFVVENPTIGYGCLGSFFEPYTYSGNLIHVDFTDEITYRTVEKINLFLADKNKLFKAKISKKHIESPVFSGKLTYENINIIVDYNGQMDIINYDTYDYFVSFIDFMQEIGLESGIEYPILRYITICEQYKNKYIIDLMKEKLSNADEKVAQKCLYDNEFWHSLCIFSE